MGNFKDQLINIPLIKVLPKLNEIGKPYGTISKLYKDGSGFHANLKLLGSADDIEITVGNIEISKDNDFVTLTGISSNMIWLDNVAKNFLEGKPVPVPEKARTPLGWVKAVL